MKKLNQLLLTSIAIIGSASSLISAKLSNENLNGNKSFNDSHNITHDLSDWMSDLNDKKLLSDLNIPGTHDSAMFDCVGAACTFGKWYALTQGANFAEQLKLGIRFFDLRLTRNPELWMAHGVVWANNQNLEKTLDSFVEFLKNHPTEFIIIRVKDENTSVKAEDREWEKYFLNVMKKPKYNDYLFKNSNKNKNANPSVKELRGKILTFNHFHHLITTNADFGPLYRNNNIIFQDLYNLNHENKKVAISDTLNMSNNEINLKTYVNFISRANGEKPWYTAKELNPWLLNYLREHPEIVRLGILPMDFPVENLVSEIIKRNFAVKPKEITRNLFDPIINKNIEITSLQDNTDFVQFSQSAKNFHCNVYLEDELIGSSVIGENLEIKLSKKIKYNQNLKFYFYKLTPHNDFYKETKYNEIHQTMYVQPNLIWMKKLSDYKNFVLKFKDNNAFLDNSVKDIFNFSVNKYIVEELNNLININKAQDSHNEELFASIQNKFQTLNNMYTDWISIFKDLSTIFKNINDNISNKFEKHIQVTNHLSFIWDSIINKFKILNQNLFNDNFNEKNIDFKNQIELVKKILNSFQIKAIENKNVDEIVLDSWNLFNNNIWGIEIYKANLNSIKTQVEDCLLLVLRSNNIEEFNDSISKYNLTRTKLDKYISSTHNFIEQTNQIVNDFTSLSANQIESIKNEFVNTIANLDNEQEKNRFFEKIRNYHIIFNDALSLFNESNILKNKLESLEFSTEETNKFLAKLKEFKENIENNYYLFDNQTKLIQDMSDIKVLMNEVNIKLNDYINQKKQFEKLKTAINNNQFNFKEVYDLIYKYFEKKDSSSESTEDSATVDSTEDSVNAKSTEDSVNAESTEINNLKTAINNNQFNFKEVYDLIYKYFEKKDSSSESTEDSATVDSTEDSVNAESTEINNLKTAINNNQFNFKEVYDLIHKYFEKKDSSSETSESENKEKETVVNNEEEKNKKITIINEFKTKFEDYVNNIKKIIYLKELDSEISDYINELLNIELDLLSVEQLDLKITELQNKQLYFHTIETELFKQAFEKLKLRVDEYKEKELKEYPFYINRLERLTTNCNNIINNENDSPIQKNEALTLLLNEFNDIIQKVKNPQYSSSQNKDLTTIILSVAIPIILLLIGISVGLVVFKKKNKK